MTSQKKATPQAQSNVTSPTDVQLILMDALQRTWADTAGRRVGADPLSREWAEVVRDAWIRSLRDAFWECYRDKSGGQGVAVFGGKPRPGERKEDGVSSGIKAWRRWEFMYDVAVVRVSNVPAAYAMDVGDQSGRRSVAMATEAIWLVESEVAKDGTEVAIDASKLWVGRAENSLFIAAQTTREDKGPWLNFLGRALAGVQGNVYLAIIPSYASGQASAAHWWDQTVDIVLYCRQPDGLFTPVA
jgi:hypothetical protein